MPTGDSRPISWEERVLPRHTLQVDGVIVFAVCNILAARRAKGPQRGSAASPSPGHTSPASAPGPGRIRPHPWTRARPRRRAAPACPPPPASLPRSWSGRGGAPARASCAPQPRLWRAAPVCLPPAPRPCSRSRNYTAKGSHP